MDVALAQACFEETPKKPVVAQDSWSSRVEKGMVSRSLRFWATTLTSGACDVSQDARRSAREEIVFHVRGERWGEMAEGHYGSHSSFATAGMLVLIQNFRSHRPRRHLGWRICTVHEARPTTLDMASRTAVNEGDIKKWKKKAHSIIDRIELVDFVRGEICNYRM